MSRILCLMLICVAGPAWAGESTWPNKPGKKRPTPLVVGAQDGLTTKAPSDVVIGAGATLRRQGGGDYGFISPESATAPPARRAVGYDPARRLGNKAPTS